ncbi:MAG: hypothetical protein AB7U79_06055 [Candidatus Izemoplasmatales bacterium]
MFVFGFLAFFIVIYLFIRVIFKDYFSLYREMKGSGTVGRQSLFLNTAIEFEPTTDSQERILEFYKSHQKSTKYNLSLLTKTSYQAIDYLIKKDVLIYKTSVVSTSLVRGLVFIALLLFSLFFMNYFLLIQLNFVNVGLVIYILFGLEFLYLIIKKYIDVPRKTLKYVHLGIGITTVIVFFMYSFFGGRVFLNAEAYSELISVSEGTFSSEINTVDITTLPIVDKSYGEKLGSIKLGEYPAIGSEFEAGEYSDILYNGVQYLVAPLEYRGWFQWFKNRDFGTPGYIMINKITSETKLVIFPSDSAGMKYTPSAYYDNHLKRYAYNHGLSSYHLESSYFEIDDSGVPYYVMSYSLPTIGINGGWDIAVVATVQAVTGEVNIYKPSEVPAWVESVYPEELFIRQLNYFGSLQDGWFNSFLAQKGVLQASEGTRTVTIDGRLNYFTGLTSAGSDESTVGFVYMDTIRKQTKLFYFPGATEYAAMAKTITLLPQNNITSSFPIPINVEGVPTYFMLIKGEDGRILRNVFMSVQNLEIYGMSETKTESYNAYIRNLSVVIGTDLVVVSGIIDSISSYVVAGNTMYWIEVDGDYYLLDVSDFDIDQMQYFIAKHVGDTISFNTQGSVIVSFNTN